MLNSIIEFSVRNKLIIGLMVLALIITGAYEATQLPIDAVPDITNNQVLVITQAPAYGANDIERLVTFPIEQANSNISGLKEIRSFSRFGLSLVTIVFDDNIDIYWARQQVTERLQQVKDQIPNDIGSPELGPISTGLGEIYQYVVRAKKGYENKYTPIELRTIQDWIIRRQLIGVNGVAEVCSFGGKLKQYEIALVPDKLNSYGISIEDVFQALEQNNQNTGGAYIEKGPTALYIRSEGLVTSMQDIENIAIRSDKLSIPLFLRDVAEVREGTATRYGAICYNDEGEVAGGIVMMLKGANSSAVVKRVKERMEQVQRNLPEGVLIEPFLDRTKMVNHAIGTVKNNLLEGALIVVFVLVFFLGNLRAGFLVASVIPLAMLFAVCMMNLFGVSGNLMSLGALDFGLIVDGAVIIVEAVMHQLHHPKHRSAIFGSNQMNETVALSSKKMMNSSVFGQLIILIVYLPIFTLQGIEGKMFKPMAQTVAFALLGAFLLSLTYIPMMSSLVLSAKHQSVNFSDRIMRSIGDRYRRVLFKAIRKPAMIFSSVVALFLISLFLLSRLGGEFIPALEEGDFAVDTKVLTGSNLKTTIQFTQKAAHLLIQRYPEVEKVVSKIGSGEVPTDPMPMEACDMMVILKDKSKWTSAKTFPELATKMNETMREIPGITTGFQFPVQMRFNELMTGAKQDVVCKIFGENLDTLSHYAEILSKEISTIEGAGDLYIEPVTGLPQIIIQYDRQAMAQYHLNVEEVNRIVNTAFAGQTCGQLYEEEKHFDIVVRLKEDSRHNLEDIRHLLIPISNGLQIPLSQIAEVDIRQGINQIQREDAKRRIVVGFNVKGRDVQGIVDELQKKVMAHVKFQPGYYVTFGGAFQNLEQAKRRLLIAVPTSLLLIFVLLYFAFRNLKQGLLIYTTIPLSAIGGIFFLAARGMPFSISAGIGFIALFGVAVLNGIVLISEFNRLKNEGIRSVARIIISGTNLRLRPVLMTAFVASLGFLPMAVSNGAGAEVQRPLATVVIGGLLVATLLTLFVIPLLYILSENGLRMKKMKRIFPVLLLALLSSFYPASSQRTISLEESIQLALQNNATVKNERLKMKYHEALTNTSKEIPRTAFTTEWGQMNSALFDTKIGMNQTLPFPGIYKKQKEILNAHLRLAEANMHWKEYELKKEVYMIFSRYIYLKEKENLLGSADTLFTRFYEKASLRLQKGESNILEKTTAENQLAEIRIQRAQAQEEIDILLLQFQYLLNDADVIPWFQSGILPQSAFVQDLSNHPLVQIGKELISQAKAETILIKAGLKPDFNFSLNNMSIRGIGADDRYYSASHRFTSASIGISVPVFQKSQKERIKALGIQEDLLLNELDHQNSRLKTAFQQGQIAYDQSKTLYDDFQTNQLKNAVIIETTAEIQFLEGEINYLEYVMLLHQSFSIRNRFIELEQDLNQSIIKLNFISFNN